MKRSSTMVVCFMVLGVLLMSFLARGIDMEQYNMITRIQMEQYNEIHKQKQQLQVHQMIWRESVASVNESIVYEYVITIRLPSLIVKEKDVRIQVIQGNKNPRLIIKGNWKFGEAFPENPEDIIAAMWRRPYENPTGRYCRQFRLPYDAVIKSLRTRLVMKEMLEISMPRITVEDMGPPDTNSILEYLNTSACGYTPEDIVAPRT